MIQKSKLYGIVCVLSLTGYAWVYMNYFYLQASDHTITTCMIKSTTGIPCPSCGTTRSVMTIFHGDFAQGFLINPLGYLMIVIAIIFPFWILIDILFKKSGFHAFYLKTEKLLLKKWLSIPLILLVLINWIWNIHKAL